MQSDTSKRTTTPVSSRVLLAALILFGCRAALSLAVVPPWQQPDEPGHVAFVEILRHQNESDPAREAEILQSMAEYDWWIHYGQPGPVRLPERFGDRGGIASTTLGGSPTLESHPQAYYRAIGGMLSLMPPTGVVVELYLMRALAVLFGALTIWIAWRGTRIVLGEFGGSTIALLLATHPQFVVVSTTASPDALVNLFGAVLWWQTTRAVQRSRAWLPLAAVWMAAIAGASFDRMGVPLLVTALATSLIVVMLNRGAGKTPLIVFATLLLGLCGWAIQVVWRTSQGAVGTHVSTSDDLWFLVPAGNAVTWEFLVRFSSGLIESWWFSLGWVRYLPPVWWVTIAVVLSAIGFAGVARRLREKPAGVRSVVMLALLALGIQIAAVYWTYFRIGHGAQGRHLFPCIVPTLLLLWMGIESWVPVPYRRHASLVAAGVFALLDLAAWTLVAVPAYLG